MLLLSTKSCKPSERKYREACRFPRRAFTLIELVVAIAIIGILFALLLPAVQAARENARRMQCSNNLHQWGISLHNHHSVFKAFPNAVRGSGVTHYWMAQLLPYIDQANLAVEYDYMSRFDSYENKDAVQAIFPLTICPSKPDGATPDPLFRRPRPRDPDHPEGWGSFGADYAASSGPDRRMWRRAPGYSWAGYTKPARIDGFFEGAVRPGVPGRRSRDIWDGLSNSVAIVECAARPQVWQAIMGRVPGSGLTTSNLATEYVVASSWAAGNIFAVRGYEWQRTVANPFDRWRSPGPRMINATNRYSIYSFHPGGAHVGMADGSVRFVNEAADAKTICQMLTIQGGEVQAKLAQE